MRKSVMGFVPVFLSVFFCQFVPTAEATIQRVDSCAGQFSRTQGVPIRRGTSNKRITVRGDFVDTNTGVEAPSGITVHQLDQGGGGGLNTFVVLELTIGASVTPGIKAIKLHYLVEFSGPDVFNIDVREIRIDTIRIREPLNATHILKGTPVTVEAEGDGLSNLQLNSTGLQAFGNATFLRNVTLFTINGIANSNISLSAGSFFDSSISNLDSCAPARGTGTLNVPVGLPNLVPLGPSGVYRLTSPPEVCQGVTVIPTADAVCVNIFSSIPDPTATNPHVEGVVRVPTITWGVVNNSPFPMPARSFKIQLKVGINLLQEEIVEPAEFTHDRRIRHYSRAENRRMVMRDLNCPKCYDLQVAPYNWVDPPYTISVDVDTDIDESNENDNIRTNP